ncbi:hypothetical protein EDWATA_02467 [Edwardsiella tarda ATCC 23685]|uniref:Uncharacterized protein n=1 Tax=Edwardsiella tarda ATCC 23685 TaxID=500638 RepID=D4F6T3_EDWTA|nr:hypothetical protein EDWATA_02467 [Edwardsiella tarda ATCC 23685]
MSVLLSKNALFIHARGGVCQREEGPRQGVSLHPVIFYAE